MLDQEFFPQTFYDSTFQTCFKDEKIECPYRYYRSLTIVEYCHICFYIIFSAKFEVILQTSDISSQNILRCFSKNKAILLHNFNTITTPGII